MEPRPAFRTRVAREVEKHRWISRPRLAEEDAVDDLRSLDQFRQHLAVVRRKFGDVRRDFGRGEARGHLLELRLIGLLGILRSGQGSGGQRAR